MGVSKSPSQSFYCRSGRSDFHLFFSKLGSLKNEKIGKVLLRYRN